MYAPGPTNELLEHRQDYDAPKINQQEQRGAYKLNSVVDRLLRNGEISQDQHRSAERFYKDAIIASSQPGLIARYGERIGSSTTGYSASERRSHHFGRIQKALDVLQPEQRQMAMLTIVQDKGLTEAAEVVFRGPRSSRSAMGKITLIFALRELEKHYEN